CRTGRRKDPRQVQYAVPPAERARLSPLSQFFRLDGSGASVVGRVGAARSEVAPARPVAGTDAAAPDRRDAHRGCGPRLPAPGAAASGALAGREPVRTAGVAPAIALFLVLAAAGTPARSASSLEATCGWRAPRAPPSA